MNFIPKSTLIKLAEQRYDEFLCVIPYHVYEQLADVLTWSEKIEDREIDFCVSVLENTDEYLHISVDIGGGWIEERMNKNQLDHIITDDTTGLYIASTSFILKK